MEGWNQGIGRWVSKKGMVEIKKPENEYGAWVFLGGKKFRIRDSNSPNGLFISAEVAIGAIDRVWRWSKENGNKIDKNR